MKYSAKVFEQFDAGSLAEWQVVHGQVGCVFSDPRYLQLIQNTLGEIAPIKLVIFYDGKGIPIGVCSMSSCQIDVAQMAPPWARRIVGSIRRVWPSYLKLKTVLCGPATTILQQRMYILAGVDRQEILLVLDALLCEFARERRASVILMGDFDTSDRPWLNALEQMDYVVGDSHPANLLSLPYATFEEYLACMRSDPARKVRHNRKQLAKPDVTVDHYWGGVAAAQAFTEQHYALYLELVERVDLSITTLPLEFFREMLAVFPDAAHLVDIRVAGKVAAFGVGLHLDMRYEALFVGYNEDLNHKYALYFNVFFEAIKAALEAGCVAAELGATSDTFKARVGAHPRARTMYVKAPGFFRYPLRWFSKLVLPPHPATKPRNIFAREPAASDCVDRDRTDV